MIQEGRSTVVAVVAVVVAMVAMVVAIMTVVVTKASMTMWVSKWISLGVRSSQCLGVRQAVDRHQAGHSHQKEQCHGEL